MSARDARTPPSARVPALFVGHGAAIFTTSPDDATNRFLSGLAAEVDAWRPRGLLVVSAHHAARPLRMTGAGDLATIHDHPASRVHAYRYPGRGDPALELAVLATLARAGLPVVVDPARGLDHGAWVPLSLLAPRGDVPVAQLSLDAGWAPRDHVALGRALAPLRDQGVLLIGSGGVTHDQSTFRRAYFAGADRGDVEAFARIFDAWASAIVTTRRGDDRAEALAAFREHPLALRAHPTPEHFLPLLVIAAAAGDDRGEKLFEGFQHSLSTSAFGFGVRR